MKLPLSLLLIFLCMAVFSQEVPKEKTVQSYYIPLQEYKELGKELTKQDSLDFRFHRGDTLVKMPTDYIPPKLENGFEMNYEFRKPEFLEIYKDIVFYNDSQHLRLWEDEIKIFFNPSVPEKHRMALQNFTRGLSAGVDSLKISEVQKLEDANFHIYYTNSKDTVNYEPHLNSFTAGYYVYWNNRNKLTKGFLKVDTDAVNDPVHQIANLKNQFFNSLGMFHDSNQIKSPAYLSGFKGIRSLTSMDMEILKYHYSYNKPNGVDRKGFDKFHREMQEIYQKDPSARIYITPSQ